MAMLQSSPRCPSPKPEAPRQRDAAGLRRRRAAEASRTTSPAPTARAHPVTQSVGKPSPLPPAPPVLRPRTTPRGAANAAVTMTLRRWHIDPLRYRSRMILPASGLRTGARRRIARRGCSRVGAEPGLELRDGFRQIGVQRDRVVQPGDREHAVRGRGLRYDHTEARGVRPLLGEVEQRGDAARVDVAHLREIHDQPLRRVGRVAQRCSKLARIREVDLPPDADNAGAVSPREREGGKVVHRNAAASFGAQAGEGKSIAPSSRKPAFTCVPPIGTEYYRSAQPVGGRRRAESRVRCCIWCNTCRYTASMPTNHRRIPVTNDPELAEALARVASHFPGAPAARVVHDLAVKGAEALAREREGSEQALERLVELSTLRGDALDWDMLERVDELAWGE